MKDTVGTGTLMNRVWAMPSRDTFDIEPIHNFVWKYLHSARISIDPFARNKRWATYTNDLHPETKAEFHMEAAKFLNMLACLKVKADVVLFDPPYSLEQCKRSYESVGLTVREADTQTWGFWPTHKRLIHRLLNPGGVVLSFGWNSVGMGKKYGYSLEEIMLVCHGKAHNDTICIAERKTQPSLAFAQPTT